MGCVMVKSLSWHRFTRAWKPVAIAEGTGRDGTGLGELDSQAGFGFTSTLVFCVPLGGSHVVLEPQCSRSPLGALALGPHLPSVCFSWGRRLGCHRNSADPHMSVVRPHGIRVKDALTAGRRDRLELLQTLPESSPLILLTRPFPPPPP